MEKRNQMTFPYTLIFGYVRSERAQPINTIFLKIEFFTICLHQISDVGELRPGRE